MAGGGIADSRAGDRYADEELSGEDGEEEMKIEIILVLILVSAIGCDSKPATLPVGGVTSDAVKDDSAYRNFIKVWHYQVTPEVQINVTTTLTPWLSKCDSFGCSSFALRFGDELKQRDDKWASFDCDRVADKIIDRDLVTKVEEACESIHATATAYWKTNNDPSEFTGKDGRVWKRQP